MQTGRLIILTGPSGVGKGTLLRLLLKKHPELCLSISATTRQPRPGEIDGQDYYFVSRQKFEQMVTNNELLEWAEYAGNYYGTPRPPVEQLLQQGKSVILEIEVVGANKVKKSFPQVERIFILPPSLTELEQRMRGRAKDSDEAIAKRLSIAKSELEQSDQFDWQIVNEDKQKALEEIEEAIFSE
ncbi:MAG: guanylate kinase [Coleofasciculaceae cyanobacterium]